MTDWLAFAGFASILVLVMLLLARATQSMLDDLVIGEAGEEEPQAPFSKPGTAGGESSDVLVEEPPQTGFDAMVGDESDTVLRDPGAVESDVPGESGVPEESGPEFRLTSMELFANVVFTHGLFAGFLVAAAFYWDVPAEALGAVPEPLGVLGSVSPTVEAVVLGIAFGLALAAANEVSMFALDRAGIGYEDTLRELLSPSSAGGWVALLGVVLPLVAISEELLFRAVLIGVFAETFALSPWLLAIVSSILFAIGHGAQGRGGILVTGLLGFVLAAGFVLTGSLLLVIVAHYVVNAVELVAHEGLGIEPLG